MNQAMDWTFNKDTFKVREDQSDEVNKKLAPRYVHCRAGGGYVATLSIHMQQIGRVMTADFVENVMLLRAYDENTGIYTIEGATPFEELTEPQLYEFLEGLDHHALTIYNEDGTDTWVRGTANKNQFEEIHSADRGVGNIVGKERVIEHFLKGGLDGF